jgi:hypothetical protein
MYTTLWRLHEDDFETLLIHYEVCIKGLITPLSWGSLTGFSGSCVNFTFTDSSGNDHFYVVSGFEYGQHHVTRTQCSVSVVLLSTPSGSNLRLTTSSRSHQSYVSTLTSMSLIVSRTHTYPSGPSHSQTSRLLNTSLSVGIPFHGRNLRIWPPPLT